MTQAEYILATAKQALNDYGIQEFSLSEVGDMIYDRYQTVKYACDTEVGRRLLSIHVLREGADLVEEAAFFASQLLWLEALDRDVDLCVQVPIRNDKNELITVVPGTPDLLLTLTQWVPGVLLDGGPLEEEDEESPLTLEQARGMGELLARLHRHSEEWTLPSEFRRLDHPVGQVDAFVVRLESARVDKRIFESDFAVTQRLAERVENALSACGRERGVWGLLHGDFTAGNCVIDAGQLYPIDFDSCSMGNYLADIAHCLLMHEADPQVTHSLLEGYRSIRNLEGDWLDSLEAMILAMVLWDLSESVDRRNEFSVLSSFVEREFEKYLRAERFIFDEERTWL